MTVKKSSHSPGYHLYAYFKEFIAESEISSFWRIFDSDCKEICGLDYFQYSHAVT